MREIKERLNAHACRGKKGRWVIFFLLEIDPSPLLNNRAEKLTP
jgi:hypothetical protein